MGACVVHVCESVCVCACIKMRSSLLYNFELQFILPHCVRRTASSPHMIRCTMYMYIVQAVKYLFTSELSILWPFKTQDSQKHEDIQWIGVIVEK